MIDYTFDSEKSFKKLLDTKPKGFERTGISELLER